MNNTDAFSSDEAAEDTDSELVQTRTADTQTEPAATSGVQNSSSGTILQDATEADADPDDGEANQDADDDDDDDVVSLVSSIRNAAPQDVEAQLADSSNAQVSERIESEEQDCVLHRRERDDGQTLSGEGAVGVRLGQDKTTQSPDSGAVSLLPGDSSHEVDQITDSDTLSSSKLSLEEQPLDHAGSQRRTSDVSIGPHTLHRMTVSPIRDKPADLSLDTDNNRLTADRTEDMQPLFEDEYECHVCGEHRTFLNNSNIDEDDFFDSLPSIHDNDQTDSESVSDWMNRYHDLLSDNQSEDLGIEISDRLVSQQDCSFDDETYQWTSIVHSDQTADMEERVESLLSGSKQQLDLHISSGEVETSSADNSEGFFDVHDMSVDDGMTVVESNNEPVSDISEKSTNEGNEEVVDADNKGQSQGNDKANHKRGNIVIPGRL